MKIAMLFQRSKDAVFQLIDKLNKVRICLQMLSNKKLTEKDVKYYW